MTLEEEADTDNSLGYQHCHPVKATMISPTKLKTQQYKTAVISAC